MTGKNTYDTSELMLSRRRYGTYGTAEAINAGLDLEMPGPTKFRGELLRHVVGAKKVSTHELDERVRNVLNLVDQCAVSGIADNQEEGTRDIPETAALLRQLAAESIVLFKNERDVLPLRRDQDVLLIGPNAKTAVFCGGGSSAITPYYAVSPYDGVAAKLTNGAQLTHAIGCYAHKELPLISLQTRISQNQGSGHGATFRAYNEPPGSESRPVLDEIHLRSTSAKLMDYQCAGIESGLWYADVEAFFTADRDGKYEFGLCVYGTGKLYIDGKLIIDNETEQTQGTSFYGCGTIEEKGTVKMQKDVTYRILLQFASAPTSKTQGEGGTVRLAGGGFRIGGAWARDMEATIAEAVAMATQVQQVVICAGLNQDWEGEGADRADMKLPGETDRLIAAVAEANPNVVVVNQSGTPVEMPWKSQVAGILQAWYGGNETGNAIADVLFGDHNPSGRSSLSWPQKVQHNPAFLNYRSEGGRTLYGEDVYVGYRFYEAVDRQVNFPFGFGLSYTTFELSDLHLRKTGEGLSAVLELSLSVSNTGTRDGQDIIQVYVSQRNPAIRRPVRELKAFSKVLVEAGSTESVSVELELKYATSYWDETRSAWLMERDSYEVEVTDGTGQLPSLRAGFAAEESRWWNGL